MQMTAGAGASDKVCMIAGPDSDLADSVSAGLAKLGVHFDRVETGQLLAGDRVAVVVIVERDSEVDELRATLDQSNTPALVLVPTHELAMRIIPLLDAWHDLALTTDAAEVLAWRLRRLIELARFAALGPSAFDSLTGLLSRTTFDHQLHHRIRSSTSGEVVGLLMLDLDRFKAFNDLLGHRAGDRLLQDVGRILPRYLAPGDLVARLGGDEFGVLLVRSNVESVRRAAERLLAAITKFGVVQTIANPSIPHLTASAGLTCARTMDDVDGLMFEAEMAMYRAKSAGRNRLEVFADQRGREEKADEDARLQHLENMARVSAERLVDMIALGGRKLVGAAAERASQDPLTRLGNLGYLNQRLQREIRDAHAQARPLCLALVDLDRFRDLNASYGWPSGSRVLQTFAKLAKDTIRSTDWVARYAGDEFVLVMPDTDLDQALQVAERVRQAFADCAIESVDGQRISATLSASVVQLPVGVESVESLLNLASEALKGKPTGRNRIERVPCAANVAGEDAAPCDARQVPSPRAGRPGRAPGTVRGDVGGGEDPFDLERFVVAQSAVHERFVGELRRGRKLTHCMWFTFPQLAGLGHSHESNHYGITGLEEAVAYLEHPVLGGRLRECAAALEALAPNLSVDDVFRYPDDLKLRSCLTLFSLAAGPGSIFERLIDRYFEGRPDQLTLCRLPPSRGGCKGNGRDERV